MGVNSGFKMGQTCVFSDELRWTIWKKFCLEDNMVRCSDNQTGFLLGGQKRGSLGQSDGSVVVEYSGLQLSGIGGYMGDQRL